MKTTLAIVVTAIIIAASVYLGITTYQKSTAPSDPCSAGISTSTPCPPSRGGLTGTNAPIDGSSKNTDHDYNACNYFSLADARVFFGDTSVTGGEIGSGTDICSYRSVVYKKDSPDQIDYVREISVHMNPVSKAHLLETTPAGSMARMALEASESAHQPRTSVSGYGDLAYWEPTGLLNAGKPQSITFTVEKNCQSLDVTLTNSQGGDVTGSLVLQAESAAKIMMDRGIFYEGELRGCKDSTQTSPAPVTSTGAKDVCGYITPQELNSVVPKLHAITSQPQPPEICLYSKGDVDGEVAGSLAIMLTGASRQQVEATWKEVLQMQAKPVSGIGETAAEIDNGPIVMVYFLKNGTIGTMMLKVESGKTVADVSAQVQKLAKFAASKM